VTGVAALFAVVGAACVVKATSYALIPAAALALVLALWRSPVRSDAFAVLVRVAAAVAALAITLGTWVLIARITHQAAAAQVGVVTGSGGGGSTAFNVREFLSYLWQFYLPRLGFLSPFHTPASTLPAWDLLFKGAWGAFGWLEITFPSGVYLVLLGASAAIAVLAAAGLWRDRRRLDWAVALFLVVVVVGLLAGLHVTDYRQIKDGAQNFFQGRYVLPLAPIAGAALARALLWFPSRWRTSAVAAALAALFILDVFSLGLMIERFYA
jgi:hypothetical protein